MSVIDDIRMDTATMAGKYLTFQLGDGSFGLEIHRVREIIGLIGITAVPRTPEHVRGVINLRGKVIPVIDLRREFGMEAVEATEETCIIVAQVDEQAIGVLVDRVSEVLDIADEEIEDAPSFGGDVATDYILGLGKAGDHVSILLDIDEVLRVGEIRDICATA